MAALTLSLSRGGWHDLLIACQTKRQNVRVPRALLEKLIIDHGHVIARLKSCGVDTTENEEEDHGTSG